MVRKKFKMALWSLVLSTVTLLVLAFSFFITNTNFGKNLNVFNTTQFETDLADSYLEIEKLISEKQFLMLELNEQLEKVQLLKTENDSLKSEINFKYQQIETLILKIESLEKDVSKLMSLKKEIAKAKKEYDGKTPEDNAVKNTNKTSLIEAAKENIIAAKNDSLSNVSTIEVKNESPIKDFIKDEDENVRLLNSRILTYHKKPSGQKKLTTSVSKANLLVLDYTLYVDKNIKGRSNLFYIQIFDTNNKSVGKTKSTYINDNELVYSFESKVTYYEKVNQLSETFSIEGLNLDKGVYFLNIFSVKGKLLCSRSFELE